MTWGQTNRQWAIDSGEAENYFQSRSSCFDSLWNRQIKWKLNLSWRINYRSVIFQRGGPKSIARQETCVKKLVKSHRKAQVHTVNGFVDANRSNTKIVFKNDVFIENLSKKNECTK